MQIIKTKLIVQFTLIIINIITIKYNVYAASVPNYTNSSYNGLQSNALVDSNNVDTKIDTNKTANNILIDTTRVTPNEYTDAGNPRFTMNCKLPYKNSQIKTGTMLAFGSVLLGIATTVTLYQQAWYPDSTSSRFNFENLEYGWNYALQLDKVGHCFGGFIGAYLSNEAFTASGMNPDDAALYGALGGLFFQTFMEVQDGFHTNYGFDFTDELSNAVGAGYFYAQRKIPALQNYRLKWSPGPSYRDSARNAAQIRNRLLVDDYDGQNVWLSVKLHNVLPNSMKDYCPKWLCLALGYGAKDVELIGYKPYRTAYLSLDYDLVSLLPNMGAFGNWLVQSLNNFRLPAPAVQIYPNVKFFILYPFQF